jgi:hypothetical protein
MSPSLFSRAVAVVVAGSLVLAVAPARADDPQNPPDYQKQPYQGPQYTAPLYQQTQPSYVPQSVALSGPREIKDWNEGDPIPPGYRPVERTRKGLIVGGAVTFGTLYLLTVLVTAMIQDVENATGSKDNVSALYVPALGPFIQMASTSSSSGNVVLAIDGAGQTAGAIMLIVGLTSPKTVLVRNDLAEIRFAPVITRGSAGAGLVGTF